MTFNLIRILIISAIYGAKVSPAPQSLDRIVERRQLGNTESIIQTLPVQATTPKSLG
jgi:hypothetical protein